MTRLRFILALLLGKFADAQCGFGTRKLPIEWKDGKALNNQCPICGTMADQLNTSTWGCQTMNYSFMGMQPATVRMAGEGFYEGKYGDVYANLTRCRLCNNAFFQESEPRRVR